MHPLQNEILMRILLAVVEDLYTFAVSMIFPSRGDYTQAQRQLSSPAPRTISPFRTVVDMDVYHGAGDSNDGAFLSEEEYDFFAEEEVPTDVSDVYDGVLSVESPLPQKHTIVYCAHAQVPLRTTPDSATDTAIGMVSYGDMLMVLGTDAGYTYVAVGNKRGYVPTSTVAQEAASVYPTFVIGVENGPNASNTVRLRLVIRDEFSTRLAQLPLQAHEYVYYKLLRRGASFVWPDVRPRTPGTWTRILSLLEGVTASAIPTAGAVMEYVFSEGDADEHKKAHLAYVEKVFPDQSIQISEADFPDRGIYNERILTESQWRECAPSFITIG